VIEAATRMLRVVPGGPPKIRFGISHDRCDSHFNVKRAAHARIRACRPQGGLHWGGAGTLGKTGTPSRLRETPSSPRPCRCIGTWAAAPRALDERDRARVGLATMQSRLRAEQGGDDPVDPLQERREPVRLGGEQHAPRHRQRPHPWAHRPTQCVQGLDRVQGSRNRWHKARPHPVGV
jgi:hypothetical protein